jgi:hypothetical protein
MGIQIGVVDDTLPNQTFEICRGRDGSVLVAVSSFRLGELPNVRLGVATVTAARKPSMSARSCRTAVESRCQGRQRRSIAAQMS